MNSRFDDMNNRFDTLKRDVDKRFDDMKRDVDKRFDDMKLDMDNQFRELRATRQWLVGIFIAMLLGLAGLYLK